MRKEALSEIEVDERDAAIKAEYNNTSWKWCISQLSEALTTRLVLKKKLGPKNSMRKYKARVVAKGYQQRPNFSNIETFAGVVKNRSSRILLATAAALSWDVYQMDIETAFLNGDLEEEVYMHAPKDTSCRLACRFVSRKRCTG